MSREENCKICNDGKLWKNLNVHLRHKHNTNRAEYNRKFPEEAIEVVDESYLKREEKDEMENLLKTYDVSEEELRRILNSRKALKSTSLREELRQRKGSARMQAMKIIDNLNISGKDKVEVYDLDVAEALVKEFGFVCHNVVRATVERPKHWVIERR